MCKAIRVFIKKVGKMIVKGFCNTGMCDSISYNPFYMTYGIGMVRHYSSFVGHSTKNN